MKSIIFNGATDDKYTGSLDGWEYDVRQPSQDLISVEIAACRLDKRLSNEHLTLLIYNFFYHRVE